MSKLDVLGADLEAFVLVFPEQGGDGFEDDGDDFLGEFDEEFLGGLGGGFEALLVVGAAGAFFLPVGDLMDGAVALGPGGEELADVWRELGEWEGGFVAVDAAQPVVADVAGQVGEERGPAAFGDGIAEGDVDEALLPDGAFMGGLGGEAQGGDEGVGHAPSLAVELSEGLGAPSREGDVIEGAEGSAVLAPDAVGRGLGMFVGIGHGWEDRGGKGGGLARNWARWVVGRPDPAEQCAG